MDKRIEFIDIAKGIGILLVICSHVCPALMRWALPCYIPLFFVISGYCTVSEFKISNKFKKLLIPYVFFSFLFLGLHSSFDKKHLLGVLYSRYCLYPRGTEDNVFFLNVDNAPLWFLTAMFVSYMAFWLLIRFPKYELYLAFVMFLLAYVLRKLPVLLPWSIDTCFIFALFLRSGIALRQHRILDRLKWPGFCCLLCLYGILCYASGDNVNLSVREYGRSLLLLLPAAFIGCVVLIKISRYVEGLLVAKFFSCIGRLSLPIFCLHLPFIFQIRRLLDFMHWPATTLPLMRGAVIVVLVAGITYPLAFFLNRYLLARLVAGKPKG